MNPVAAASTRRPFARWAETDDAAVVAAVAAGTLAIALRYAMAPQIDGLDDAGYLEAAQRVSQGRDLEGLFPLFRTRVGMAYPLGWLMALGWLVPSQFWILTTLAEAVTLASIFLAARWLTGLAGAGLAAVSLYAVYPLAVQQSAMFYPTAFQVMFIAVALALICRAERGAVRPGRLPAMVAGVALGLGYLVKEDVAIVVPAIVLASALTRFPSRVTVGWVCAGAAAIFVLECAGYWLTTGNPLFRLTATSGLATPTPILSQSQLHINEIWRWDGFLRPLFLLPVQVGLLWWLAIPAVWTAFRDMKGRAREGSGENSEGRREEGRGSRALPFAAVLFLLLAAYLQFGSGSFTTYSPLPKTPRYTALVTPLLMLLVGAWVARVFTAGRRTMAVAAFALVVLAAVPSVLYLDLASSERTRNTLAVLPALRDVAPQLLYTDFYGARILRILGPDLPQVSVWYHARFDTNEIVITGNPESIPEAYVLLDRQAAKIYTSSYEMALPPRIAQPPAAWQLVWTHRAYGEGTATRALLERARAAAAWLPEGNPLSSRIRRNISDMIDGDQAMLYRVPGRTSRLPDDANDVTARR